MSDLIYLPAPPKPDNFERRLADLVGKLADTGMPPIRFVWGMDHKTWFQGKEEIHYIDPNGVYVGVPYWVMEGWSQPSVYDPTEWESHRWGCEVLKNGRYEFDPTIDALGPYPDKGVWDTIQFLRNPDMTPASLEYGLEVAKNWRYNNMRPAKRSIEKFKQFQAKKEIRARQAEMELRKRVQQEVLEEFARYDAPHSDNPTVEVPSNYDGVGSELQTFTKKELSRVREAKAKADAELARKQDALLGPSMPASDVITTPGGLVIKKSALLTGN